jgi:hypothetical protein
MNPLTVATLLVVLCHPLGPGRENCVEETVVGKVQAPEAGKVDDPIPMPEMTLVECQKLAPQIIAVWLKAHPQYEMWETRGWKCPTAEVLPSHKS